jgi:hypothetical protein
MLDSKEFINPCGSLFTLTKMIQQPCVPLYSVSSSYIQNLDYKNNSFSYST